jgi:sensor c-di-GMP phosphodiesterase-like protein
MAQIGEGTLQNKRVAVAFAIVVAILAITAPIFISLYLARQQSIDEQTSRVAHIADDVLRRSDEVVVQAQAVGVKLAPLVAAAPCSNDTIAVMSGIAEASEQLQAIGYMEGNQLLCTSLGRYQPALDIGPPDFKSAAGNYIRAAVTLPNISDVKFILATSVATGITVIIHPKLPLDIFVDDPDIQVGLVGFTQRKPIDVRGRFNPRWLDALGKATKAQFIDGDRLVAVRRSAAGDLAVFATIPAGNVAARLRHFAFVLVPIGALAGIVLALAVFRVARLQLALPAVLKTALRRDELFLEYQPVVDLSTQQWVGAEALLRWRRANGELVRPDIFIPVAEDSGLISRITERVIDIVARDTVGFFGRNPDFHIAINLSPADLQSDRVSDLLSQLCSRTGGKPHNFIVEATERGVIKGDAVQTRLNRIRQFGIRVAIDDFGTGYSSLSYLQTFAVDLLKIDKSFVDTIGTDSATSNVTAHIIKMAKDLGLELIAEGVETREQAKFLLDRGVQYAQGWLFARPMSLDKLETELKSRGAARASRDGDARMTIERNRGIVTHG